MCGWRAVSILRSWIRAPHGCCHSAQPNGYTLRRSVRRVQGDPRQPLGRFGERIAAEHLERRGYQVIERNYRTRWGELDIVAYDGRTLAFCEVKTRRARAGGADPLESVRSSKRLRVRRMARSWLSERTDRPYAEVLRFDAIGVTFDLAGHLVKIEHVEGAW